MTKLVHKESLREIPLGSKLTTERNGEVTEYILRGWRKPHKPSSSGRVFVNRVDTPDGFENSFFPHVFDLKIVEDL